MFTTKFSLALLHERPQQSPQASIHFMLFFLQGHFIDPHVLGWCSARPVLPHGEKVPL